MRAAFLALTLLLSADYCLAETVPLRTDQEARALAEAALTKVVAGDFPGAFVMLQAHWSLPEAEVDLLLAQTVKQRGMVEPRFGRSLGFEFVAAHLRGNSVLDLLYIEKLEKTALRWRFIFYKPRETWIVNTVTWDDRLQDLCGGGG